MREMKGSAPARACGTLQFHLACMREMKGNTALDDWSLRRSHPARAGNESECDQQLRNFVTSHLARMREIKGRLHPPVPRPHQPHPARMREMKNPRMKNLMPVLSR